MSFNIALTGLNASSEQLSSISHNIANVGSTGFKSSRMVFGSLYAQSQALGVGVMGMSQNLSRDGTLQKTGGAMDLAISGGGFFITRGPSGEQSYTRNGAFGTDKDNWVTGFGEHRLQGYPVDAQGKVQEGVLGDLKIASGNLPAKATDSIGFAVNLNTNDKVPVVTPFDPASPASFNLTTSTEVRDSQGNTHQVEQFFVKTGANAWTVYYQADKAPVGTPQPLAFDTDGKLLSPAATVPISFSPPGVEPLNIAMDYTGSSQFGSPSLITTNLASGYPPGERTGVVIEADGKLYASYSNGQKQLQGQVALASFANTNGLQNQSGTRWSETGASGTALVGSPGTGTFGTLSAQALEGSNVEMTEQLVGLMEGQRNYQANSKVLSTYKELNQVLFNAI